MQGTAWWPGGAYWATHRAHLPRSTEHHWSETWWALPSISELLRLLNVSLIITSGIAGAGRTRNKGAPPEGCGPSTPLGDFEILHTLGKGNFEPLYFIALRDMLLIKVKSQQLNRTGTLSVLLLQGCMVIFLKGVIFLLGKKSVLKWYVYMFESSWISSFIILFWCLKFWFVSGPPSL